MLPPGQDPNTHPDPSVHVTAVQVSQIGIHEPEPGNNNKVNICHKFDIQVTVHRDKFL